MVKLPLDYLRPLLDCVLVIARVPGRAAGRMSGPWRADRGRQQSDAANHAPLHARRRRQPARKRGAAMAMTVRIAAAPPRQIKYLLHFVKVKDDKSPGNAPRDG